MLLFDKKVWPDPLPAELHDGQLTTIRGNPYRLHGGARLERGYYYGDWRREGEKSSTFVAPCLVDWDQWRAAQVLADGLTAADLVEAGAHPEVMLLTDEQARVAAENPDRPLPKTPRVPPAPVRTGEY